ncbi:metallophosphoesterase [Conexibacter sp. W3-3-2]|uniref:metallophosphoesterase n=1 Tax=Conexibacter sp. W3-3-2 TaxID=2675227 RepID=UPI0018AC087A|nr:metallophosphoesterase [Conexibacter sp. W3-3-2]
MKIFAIGDLHLPGRSEYHAWMRPYGWAAHYQQIAARWRQTIAPQDLVIVCGDTTAAPTTAAAVPDLQWLDRMPGMKLLTPGNHDGWLNHATRTRLTATLADTPTIQATHHGARIISHQHQRILIGAVIGPPPTSGPPKALARARRALEHLDADLSDLASMDPHLRIVASHYPPCGPDQAPTELSELLEAHRIDLCVYGHLHGRGQHAAGPHGTHRGVRYLLCSSDHLRFTPALLHDTTTTTHWSPAP